MNRLIAAILAGAVLAAGCAGAPVQPTPTPTPAPGALSLRAWVTQALPPEHAFARGPVMAVSDSVLIDFNVAVPAIFPGPLYVSPNASGISPAGEQALIEQARSLGLLEGKGDLTGGGVAPGGQTGHLLLIAGGETHEMIGDPSRNVRCDGVRCVAEPGTPEAFAAYWVLLTDLSWLESQLGPARPYNPARIAALVKPANPQADFPPNHLAWPFEPGLAEFGRPFGAEMRCAVIEGEDVRTLLALFEQANQLTIFVDAQGRQRELVPRALVPDEPSPCGGPAG